MSCHARFLVFGQARFLVSGQARLVVSGQARLLVSGKARFALYVYCLLLTDKRYKNMMCIKDGTKISWST